MSALSAESFFLTTRSLRYIKKEGQSLCFVLPSISADPHELENAQMLQQYFKSN